MEIRRIPISQINPAKYNPRVDLQPGDERYDLLAKSIAEFDCVEPLVWNEKTGNLVGGHQRLKILIARGDTEADVSVVNLPLSKEKALNISLNKNSGDWDLPKLKDLLQEIDTGEFNMSITGYTEQAMADLMSQFHVEPEVTEDEPPEPPKVAVSRLGDVWECGKHRVMCGDVTRQSDLFILIGESKPALVVTDPPYNVGLVYENGEADDKSAEAYREFTHLWFAAAQSSSDRQIVTPGWNNLSCWLRLFTPYYVAPWTKTNAMTRGKVARFSCWEPVLFFGEKWERKRPNDVFDFPAGTHKDTGNHPCPKPIKMWMDLLTNYSAEGETILDCFMGSGTTLIAAEQTKRIALGLEIAPVYCDVSVLRWQKLVGKEATLEATGQTFSQVAQERGVEVGK